MSEINLLDLYPRSQRPIEQRAKEVTEKDHAIARRFEKEYFDGSRLEGYGGYAYHPRFWQATVKRFRDHYGLKEDARILDVGCAKGFMLHDFEALMPRLHSAGIDVSRYAVENAMGSVKSNLLLGNARDLPFADHSFDLVISINTVHNLPLQDCKHALQEIQRVSRGHAFVTMDAWRNDQEKERLLKWNLTALSYMHVDDWKNLFLTIGYSGDYYWFIAE